MLHQRKDSSSTRRCGPRLPVVLGFPADLTTPVRAFLALTRPGEDAYLLESVAGGESQARYSFLGFRPSEIFEAGNRAHLRRGADREDLGGDVVAALSQWVTSFSIQETRPPVPFLGGAVGWMDFSAFRLFEPSLEGSFSAARTPCVVFAFFTTGVVFDHLRQNAYLYKTPLDGEGDGDCRRELEQLRARLEGALPACAPGGSWQCSTRPNADRFARNLAAIKASIVAGDAYQIVLSESFEGTFEGPPFDVYRRLRRLNPSPYHFYLALGGRQVIGASPEMLVRVENRLVSTVPIAGTRPRGATPQEDKRLERELLQDPKELAEHAMLVDLARNDLGRVCEFGSVTVPIQCSVDRFSHVMHMTSEVQGRLRPDRQALDALWSTFPAGTVSGAPKIRAVQILSELEQQDRGVYGGAVGTIDMAGNLETCIAIRTMEFESGAVRFRTGAGIVADSQPEAEWKEIHHKAAAMVAALEDERDAGEALSEAGPGGRLT